MSVDYPEIHHDANHYDSLGERSKQRRRQHMKWYANPQPRKKILRNLEHINTLMTDEVMDVKELTQEEHLRKKNSNLGNPRNSNSYRMG